MVGCNRRGSCKGRSALAPPRYAFGAQRGPAFLSYLNDTLFLLCTQMQQQVISNVNIPYSWNKVDVFQHFPNIEVMETFLENNHD